MNNKFQEVYLSMIDQNIIQQDVISESLAKNLGIAALAGLSLLSPIEAGASLVKGQNSNKIHATSSTKLTSDQDFIARVLYSQTSTLCQTDEVIAIAKIIQNRIGKRDFGNCKSAIQVCKHPGTFSSVLKHNSNWDNFFPNLNKWTKLDTLLARILSSSKTKIEGKDWMKDIVYYHDKSIKKPSSWDNKYYTAVLVKETKNFKFYKIEAKKSTPKLVAKSK